MTFLRPAWWWPRFHTLYDDDGCAYGVQCEHCEQPSQQPFVVWERWRTDYEGEDYLLRLCDACQRELWRRKHARRRTSSQPGGY